jgi:hypothetical protein
MAKLSVAEVPEGSISTEVTVMGVGRSAGTKENSEALRLNPLTWNFGSVLLANVDMGRTEVTTGMGTVVKLLLDVAVLPVTATEIGPVVAATGTWTTSVVAAADRTLATTPLNPTMLLAGVGLNPAEPQSLNCYG